MTVRLNHYSRDEVYTQMIYVYRTRLTKGKGRVWLDRLAPSTLTVFNRGRVDVSRESVYRELIRADT